MLPASIGFQSDWLNVLQAVFVRDAFLAGSLVAVAAGLLGYFVVIRETAFAAHALAHIGFPGATLAVLVGIPITLGLGIFCILGALAIAALGKEIASREIATGTILAFATGLGILFNSMATQSANTVTNVLFGNLLAVSADQLVTFLVVTLVLVAVLAVIGRPLTLASISPAVAEARGVSVRALGVVFMVMLALTITMAVQVVGTLLLFALVVTPSAIALRLSARAPVVIALGIAIGMAAVGAGLTIAVMFNMPPSFVIVALVFVTWLIVLGVTRARDAARGVGTQASDGRPHHHHDHDEASASHQTA